MSKYKLGDCKSAYMRELGDCINNPLYAKEKTSLQGLLNMCKGVLAPPRRA